jgi:hypothetical protein
MGLISSTSRTRRPPLGRGFTTGLLYSLIGLVWLVGASASAAACPASDADCFQDAAIDAMKAADWASAVTAWERAYAARPDAAFVFNLASTYDQWGSHCREALAAFDRYFAVCPEGTDCPQRTVATSRREHIDGKCHGTLKVETVPPKAQVTVGDEARGPGPLELRLMEGTYRVMARQPEGGPIERAARVTGGQTTRVVLRFPEPEVAVVPAPTPTVVTEPTPPPPDEGFGNLKWAAFGVGAVGIVAGVVFTATSLQAVDDEETERSMTDPDRDRILDLRDTATRDAVMANLGYGIGVLGLSAGAVMLWMDASQDEASAWLPMVGPGVAGVRARF